MACVLGTNCGFVTVAPTDDPDDLAFPSNFGDGLSMQITSPAGNWIVTEMGMWQNSTEDPSACFNMGIYDDDDNNPGSLIATQCSGNYTVENSQQWNKYTGLNIPLDPETKYWLTLGTGYLEHGATYIVTTMTGAESSPQYRFEDTETCTLSDPFNVDGGTTGLIAIYALIEEVAVVPTPYYYTLLSRGH